VLIDDKRYLIGNIAYFFEKMQQIYHKQFLIESNIFMISGCVYTIRQTVCSQLCWRL